MSVNDWSIPALRTAELKRRAVYVSVRHARLSQYPYQVVKRRTGVVDRAFLTELEAQDHILAMDINVLANGNTTKAGVGRRPLVKRALAGTH
jgi:hypothetical protein